MIISASRRTDIPAFYSEWFFNRLQAGFVIVPNPRNPHQFSRVSLLPDVVDCFVFWTKNPAPMLPKLDKLSEYPFYFQFTLTAYQKEIEPNLPTIENQIAIFKQLATQVGKSRVVWRYDPILLNANYTIDYHVAFFNQIATSLRDYTDTCIISFIDEYQHLKIPLRDQSITSLNDQMIQNLCQRLTKIATHNQITLQTCAEDVDLTDYNISHGACIDKIRIEQIAGRTLAGKNDKNQRKMCQCIESIDIGTYNTCPFGCIYCYANTSKIKLIANRRLHNKHSPKLIDNQNETDVIKERKMNSLFVLQGKLF